MLLYLRLVLSTFRRVGASRRDLLWENLALRQQLAVYQRQTHRPRLQQRDRLFWTLLVRGWRGWRDALVFVQPADEVLGLLKDRRFPYLLDTFIPRLRDEHGLSQQQIDQMLRDNPRNFFESAAVVRG